MLIIGGEESINNIDTITLKNNQPILCYDQIHDRPE